MGLGPLLLVFEHNMRLPKQEHLLGKMFGHNRRIFLQCVCGFVNVTICDSFHFAI